MLTPQALREEIYLNLSPCFKAVGALLKDSSCSYIFEFPNSNVGVNMVVMQLAGTAHNCLT